MGIFDKLFSAVIERAEKELESVVDEYVERIRSGDLKLPKAGEVSNLERLVVAAGDDKPLSIAEACPECEGVREPNADFISHASDCTRLEKAGCP